MAVVAVPSPTPLASTDPLMTNLFFRGHFFTKPLIWERVIHTHTHTHTHTHSHIALTSKTKQITRGEKVYTVKVLQKLNEDPNKGSYCLRGLKFCMEHFFTKPQQW